MRSPGDSRTSSQPGGSGKGQAGERRIRFLNHTADLGLEVEGPSLESVLEGAADGMVRLILGDHRPRAAESRTLEIEGGDADLLLRNFLRELLFMHATEGFVPAESRVELLMEGPPLRARCRLRGGGVATPPETELKGVTLHGLVAERRADGGWRGRVIFDV